MIKRLLFLSITLLTLGVFLATAQLRSPGKRPPEVALTQPVAYVFDCGGRYLKIDVNAGVALQTGTVGGIAKGSGAGYDGCLIATVEEDSQLGELYAIVPTALNVDAEGRRSYRLVSLKPPNLKISASRDFPQALDEAPQLLVDSQNRQLLVAYTLPATDLISPQTIVNRLSADSLRDSSKDSGVPPPPEKTANGLAGTLSGAHFDNGGRIVAGNAVLGNDGRFEQVIDGYSLLTNSVREHFTSLQRKGATGAEYLDITFADSAASQMLFIVGWDTFSSQSPAGGGLVIYDIASSKVVSTIVTEARVAPGEGTPGTPTVHLSPNGKLAFVEQYEWRRPEGAVEVSSSMERYKTGTISIYNTDSGQLTRTVTLTPVPGYFGRVLGFSADSEFMYYTSSRDINVVNITNGHSVTIPLPDNFLPVGVVTAGR